MKIMPILQSPKPSISILVKKMVTIIEEEVGKGTSLMSIFKMEGRWEEDEVLYCAAICDRL